jgi:hypothetical protein
MKTRRKRRPRKAALKTERRVLNQEPDRAQVLEGRMARNRDGFDASPEGLRENEQNGRSPHEAGRVEGKREGLQGLPRRNGNVEAGFTTFGACADDVVLAGESLFFPRPTRPGPLQRDLSRGLAANRGAGERGLGPLEEDQERHEQEMQGFAGHAHNVQIAGASPVAALASSARRRHCALPLPRPASGAPESPFARHPRAQGKKKTPLRILGAGSPEGWWTL